MKIFKIKTPDLNLSYEVSGPAAGEPVILVHGWPDSPRTWDALLPYLHAAGYRTIAPYLRGYGPTTFRSRLIGRRPRRTGQPVAFAQDLIHLADKLGMQRFAYIGHDWGADAAYALAAVFPDRLKSMVTLAVPFAPDRSLPPEFPQARAFWYQWLLCTQPGEKKLREDPVAFGRAQWDAWSPEGWYTETQFQAAAKSWQGRDFAEVVLHRYRSRWGQAELDPAYAALQKRLDGTGTLSTPTLLLHGAEDRCTLAETTEGADKYFTGGYRRVLVPEVGHFPQRENAPFVAGAVLEHLRQHA